MENSYGVKNFFQEGEIKISVALKKKQLFETTMLRFLTAIATSLGVTSCMGYLCFGTKMCYTMGFTNNCLYFSSK